MADYLPDQIFAPTETIKNLADTGVTPFYLYDRAGMEASVKELYQSFSTVPGYGNYLPLRDILNPELLRILAQQGSGIAVCNRAELSLALSCGFCGTNILYEPTRIDPEGETMARNAGALWLIDSEGLLPEPIPDRIILRYHPSDLVLTPGQRKHMSLHKCGFTRTQLFELVRSRGLHRVGLALQMSSYSITPGFWAKKLSTLCQLAEDLTKEAGTQIWSLYIGEGPGLPYRPKVEVPSLPQEIGRVLQQYEAFPAENRPVLLTGLTRQLLQPHGILVTKVLEHRRSHRTFAITDAGMCQFLRPALSKAYRHISALSSMEISARKVYTVVGELPTRADRLTIKDRILPALHPGDYCVVHDVGCCARSTVLLYGLQPVAGEYLYEADGSIRQIAKGRSAEEVLAFLTAL